MPEGCQALKDKIEELIQVGYFHKFIKNDANMYRSPQRDQYPYRGQKEYRDRPG